MGIVRQLRLQMGVTQAFLAKMAGTSQATIAQYESEKKSPTLLTLQRMARAMGRELFVSYVPPLTREDRRSLAYHQVITQRLRHDFDSILRRAKKNLVKMKSRSPGAKLLFDLWGDWLELPPEELSLRLLDASMISRDMRQVSPFSGVLTPKERFQILKQFHKDSTR